MYRTFGRRLELNAVDVFQMILQLLERVKYLLVTVEAVQRAGWRLRSVTLLPLKALKYVLPPFCLVGKLTHSEINRKRRLAKTARTKSRDGERSGIDEGTTLSRDCVGCVQMALQIATPLLLIRVPLAAQIATSCVRRSCL